MEEELLEKIKFVLSCKNDSQAIRMIEQYGHYKEEQMLKTQESFDKAQREILFAFEKMRTEHVIGATDEWRYSNVDLFISKNKKTTL